MNVQQSSTAAKPTSRARPAILIVEDELILAKDLQRTLIDSGYDAFAIASSAEAAVKRASERCPDLVMMDIRIKGPHDGIQTASILKKKFSTSIIYLTAHADEAMIDRAKDTEPHGYLLKPVNVVQLRTTVEMALYKHQLEQARAAKAELERQQQMALTETGRAVHEGNELFRMMIEAVKDYAIFMLEPDGRIASWNDGAERLKGYSKQEIVGQHFSTFYTADDIAAHRPERALETAARLGRAEDQGWRIRKDGTRFFADVVITAVYDASGELRGFAKVTQDVTARKHTERRLYETSSLLRAVLDSATELSIIATDPGLTIKVFNAGAERLLGYASDEVVGRTSLLLHDPDEVRVCAERLSAQIGRRIEGGEIFKVPSMHGLSREWSYVRKDGSRIEVDLVVTPMQSYEGDLLGYVGVAQDVTQHKQYEESLRRATQEAERANGAKSQFLANMSHEIRTPMNAMIGLTYLLGQTSLSSEQTGLLAQINLASKLLLAVITDVLDISKIEAGELMISRVAFSPRELLNGLHAIMRAQAELKGITLGLEMPDDLPAALEGDAARLNQILTNLLSNAIKFTERGGVTLCVGVLGCTSAGTTLSFTVRDTGIGIDPAAQARLFSPFIQADESITRRYGGTGLGLSIIGSLAKLMGGTVDFTSTVGAGSEFRVVLEFALATAESLAATQPALLMCGERPLSGVRVLVVDDYELNLVVTKRILEQAGALVWVANNGQDAFKALQLQPDHFDVVLMDVQMPIIDGYEATRRIRADLGLVDLPIIALTAGALLSERQRATAVGMDDFIIKPFDAATLISSVMHHTVGARVLAGEIHSEHQPANERVAWPEIDGVDMEEARSRLCDDPALFRSLLRRFLGDFSDMTVPSSRSVPPSLAEQASRLHKLKGGAGILGAKAIQQLAAEAEAACVAGDAARARESTIELVTHLDALRSSATYAFAGERNDERPMAARRDIRLESQAVARRERIDAPSGNHRRAHSGGRSRVLLVDDDDLVRAHVANLLEQSGYRVGEAASGEEALRALRGGDYQIVITDWKMPGMSGLELCRELRSGIDNRDLYVVMLTMSDRQQDGDLCRAAGADAYVLKSAPNEEIIACLAAARQITQPRSSSRKAERGAA
jgi:PAS domain S-box-containing protein